LTQRELADRLETDQKYIWALESGKNTIVLERIFEIMRETGIRMYMEIDPNRAIPAATDEHHG
jgi:transcriptional regulator with XRE-family HTH domain